MHQKIRPAASCTTFPYRRSRNCLKIGHHLHRSSHSSFKFSQHDGFLLTNPSPPLYPVYPPWSLDNLTTQVTKHLCFNVECWRISMGKASIGGSNATPRRSPRKGGSNTYGIARYSKIKLLPNPSDKWGQFQLVQKWCCRETCSNISFYNIHEGSLVQDLQRKVPGTKNDNVLTVFGFRDRGWLDGMSQMRMPQEFWQVDDLGYSFLGLSKHWFDQILWFMIQIFLIHSMFLDLTCFLNEMLLWFHSPDLYNQQSTASSS